MPTRGSHPYDVMVSPLDIDRMIVNQCIHDDMCPRAPVKYITNNMKMVYDKPLYKL